MVTWKREWEGSDLFGYDVIDFRIDFGRKVARWRLYINREVIKMKTNRDMLREIGYDEELLNNMSDEECAAEIQEIPYNI